eukprot:jgi/Mesvir1/2898/Mv13971-RA.1
MKYAWLFVLVVVAAFARDAASAERRDEDAAPATAVAANKGSKDSAGPSQDGKGDAMRPAAVGDACIYDYDCRDAVFCNGEEACVLGRCVAGSPPCGPGEICVEEFGSCELYGECRYDWECDDYLFCNGQETCVDSYCMQGRPPCDRVTQTCSEARNVCQPRGGTFIPCPTTQAQFRLQLRHPYGCRFIAGASGPTPMVQGLQSVGYRYYGAPIRFWNGRQFVRVGAANGHGWYRCVGGGGAYCQLSYNAYPGLSAAGQDWLYVDAAGSGAKLMQSLACADHRFDRKPMPSNISNAVHSSQNQG